jgi:hypothetical protein
MLTLQGSMVDFEARVAIVPLHLSVRPSLVRAVFAGHQVGLLHQFLNHSLHTQAAQITISFSRGSALRRLALPLPVLHPNPWFSRPSPSQRRGSHPVSQRPTPTACSTGLSP